jgi:8-oxo-dGTP pyrophosphatase MutT (NUDIX family)
MPLPDSLMSDQSRAEPALPPAIRRLAHLYWRFRRGLTLGVRAAVLDGENRVFLVRHTYVRGWHFPGGGVEPDETALDALARELREEASIELAGEPQLHGAYLNRHASDRDHVLLYVVRAFRVAGTRAPDREIAEAAFFPLAALPDGVSAGTRARLEEIASGRAPSAVW